jgi:hypothetical protein
MSLWGTLQIQTVAAVFHGLKAVVGPPRSHVQRNYKKTAIPSVMFHWAPVLENGYHTLPRNYIPLVNLCNPKEDFDWLWFGSFACQRVKYSDQLPLNYQRDQDTVITRNLWDGNIQAAGMLSIQNWHMSTTVTYLVYSQFPHLWKGRMS